MNWAVIARQDARLTSRSRSVRVLVGLLVVVCVMGGYLYPVMGTEPFTTAHFGSFITGWLTTLIPLVGLLLGYNTIVSDRVSGSVLLTLSLPYSRFDLVIGRFLGRTLVLGGGLVVGLVVAGGFVVYPFGELRLVPYVGFILLTLVFALIFTGLGVALSTVTTTKQRATVGAFGIFFLSAVLWDVLEDALAYGLATAGLIEEPLPEPIVFLFALEPGRVYDRLVIGFIDPSRQLEGTWYLSEWVALIVFVLWAIVPLFVAYRRFSEVDL